MRVIKFLIGTISLLSIRRQGNSAAQQSIPYLSTHGVDLSGSPPDWETQLTQAESNKRLKLERDLMRAIDRNNVAQVRKLVQKGVALNEAIDGEFPLIKAASQGNPELVSTLLQAGEPARVDINVQDSNGRTAAHFAAEYNHVAVLRLLAQLPHSANFNIRTQDGFTPLMRAAGRGHDAAFVFLVRQPYVDINALDSHGYTALMYAAENGHFSTVRLLVRYGAMIDNPPRVMDRIPAYRQLGDRFLNAISVAKTYEIAFYLRHAWWRYGYERPYRVLLFVVTIVGVVGTVAYRGWCKCSKKKNKLPATSHPEQVLTASAVKTTPKPDKIKSPPKSSGTKPGKSNLTAAKEGNTTTKQDSQDCPSSRQLPVQEYKDAALTAEQQLKLKKLSNEITEIYAGTANTLRDTYTQVSKPFIMPTSI